MNLKDYISEHMIYEKAFNVKTLSKAAISYYKLSSSLSPAEVFSELGGIGGAARVLLKDTDTFEAEEEVVDPNTGEVFVEKGYKIKGSDVAKSKKEYKKQHRNVKSSWGDDARPPVPPLFKTAKNIEDFESFYDIVYTTVGDVYPEDEVGTTEHDYDFDTTVPTQLTRKDRWTMDNDDKNNMKKLIVLLKNTNRSLNFAGEMAAGGKFYTVDTYLN